MPGRKKCLVIVAIVQDDDRGLSQNREETAEKCIHKIFLKYNSTGHKPG